MSKVVETVAFKPRHLKQATRRTERTDAIEALSGKCTSTQWLNKGTVIV
jgi:hypothetical protein